MSATEVWMREAARLRRLLEGVEREPAPQMPSYLLVKVSVELLAELAVGNGPITLLSMGTPDADGAYEPIFQINYDYCPTTGARHD